MPRWLGIDYGLERAGLAISDPEGRLAFPLKTARLAELGSREAFLDAIAAAARERGAGGVVLGLPLRSDGSDSLTTRQIRNAAERLKRRIPLPFFWMPEYLSSAEAERQLRACGLGGARLKGALDQQAACAILAAFLEQPEHSRAPI